MLSKIILMAIASSSITTTMEPLRLHLGGKEPHPDWKIVDIEPRPEVDYVMDASNLSLFESNSVEAIYASHILEHFYYNLDNEIINTLKEWHRVLQPGGHLFISVPNLKTICSLYLTPNLPPSDRFDLMRVLFGGQVNIYDVHKVGFDVDILARFLKEVGFTQYLEVEEFDLFNDCSSLRFLDTLISLNIVAEK
ncbi:MAG: methyltransferase domain-containing protein [Crinalium sp.]